MFGKNKKSAQEAAAEKLGSVENLGSMMQVTSPAGWIALSVCVTVMVSALVWGVLGRIPEKVSGRGILVPGGTYLQVEAGTTGKITKFHVGKGDMVNTGDVIADISTSAEESEIRFAQLRLQDLETGYEAWERREDLKLETEGADSLEKRNVVLREQADARAGYEKGKGELEGMIAKNLIRQTFSKNDVAKKELEVNALLTQLQGIDGRLVTIENELAEVRRGFELEKVAKNKQIGDQQMEVQKLEDKMKRRVNVRSNHKGRVVGMEQQVGASIESPSQVLLRLEPTDQEMHALVYALARPAKKVEKLLTGPKEAEEVEIEWNATVAPSTVKEDEDGALLGRVVRMSTVPASREEMMRDLGNQTVVDDILKSGPQLKLVVALQPDADSSSGYRWTKGRSPIDEITSGTMCDVTITVGKKRPISNVIPIFKDE